MPTCAAPLYGSCETSPLPVDPADSVTPVDTVDTDETLSTRSGQHRGRRKSAVEISAHENQADGDDQADP